MQTEEPFPAEDLGMVPLVSVPDVDKAFDRIYRELYETVAMIAPQLSVWRNWEDDTLAEQLDLIAELQKNVVLSREAFGDDVTGWRTTGNQEALSDLLTRINKVYPLLRRKIEAATR